MCNFEKSFLFLKASILLAAANSFEQDHLPQFFSCLNARKKHFMLYTQCVLFSKALTEKRDSNLLWGEGPLNKLKTYGKPLTSARLTLKTTFSSG